MQHFGPSLIVVLTCIGLVGCGIDEFLDSDDSTPSPDQVAQAALASKPAETTELQGTDVYCYETFPSFRYIINKSSKKPAAGWQWHHIVNQNPRNVQKFGNRLHCTDNLIALPKHVHGQVSRVFGSKPHWTHGEFVRNVINKRSWPEQYEFGLEVLRDKGVSP